MKKILNINTLVIFFFIFYFLAGYSIYEDYLVTPDEELHRINGFISLKYIIDFFSININNIYDFTNTPSLYEDWRKTYGVIFDLPLALYEVIFTPEIENIFLIRHFLTFIVFFISTVYFYFFLYENLSKQKLALLGTIILITTPRIFSHSFYNSKDILFLSLIIITLYYSVKFLKYNNFKSLVLSCVFCAFATNIRIIGIYIPILIFFFFIFLKKETSTKNLLNYFLRYILIYLSVLYIIWPFLWENPIQNFFIILKESAAYPNWWNFKTLYLGNYINPENLPWHYFPIWFFSTTPFFYFLPIILGLLFFLKKYLSLFLNINFKKNIELWRDKKEMINLFIFLCFFVPVFLVICLNSTLYNGWRHLFFVYPFLIYFSIFFLTAIKGKIKNYPYKIIITIICFQIISNIYFIVKSHPVQNIYFNFVSKPFIYNNFPIDYWGLGNKKTIDYLLTNNKKFSISNSSFTPLVNLKYSKINNVNYTNLVEFHGTQNIRKLSSDFIFTNYFYNRDPENLLKFKIPKNYKSYFQLIVDDIVVNEVFIK